MAGTRIRDIEGEKARRRAARKMIGEYHEQQLRLEWLREQGEEEPDWWAAGEPPRRDG